MKPNPLPERLIRLHQGEEDLRSTAVKLVETHPILQAHLIVVEQAMDLMDILRQVGTENEDEKVIQYLGMRIFNDLASALKLALSGYGQSATMILRDVLETVFLIDRFKDDWQSVAKWRMAKSKEQWKHFNPASVRKFLDQRDGFVLKKRDAAYKLLSTLASHPTIDGIEMMRPSGLDAHMGPFIELRTLEPIIAEMAKLGLQAGEAIADYLPTDDPMVQKSLSDFASAKMDWFKMIGLSTK